MNSSRVSTTPLLVACDSPDHFSRLNSLSLLEPNPIPMDVEAPVDVPANLPEEVTEVPEDLPIDIPLDMEVPPPPAKRARARYIFQRCLIPTQDSSNRLGELLAPDSDAEED